MSQMECVMVKLQDVVPKMLTAKLAMVQNTAEQLQKLSLVLSARVGEIFMDSDFTTTVATQMESQECGASPVILTSIGSYVMSGNAPIVTKIDYWNRFDENRKYLNFTGVGTYNF